MRQIAQVGLSVALLLAAGSAAYSQQAISARSGMIHYVEGKVFAGNQQVESKIGNFPQIKENEVLRTEEGRAEVLLTPGVFLRAGENSSFRMITNRLIDTRLEFLTGSMIVESDDMMKDNAVTVVAKEATVHLRKSGIYRFDAEPAALRVFKGAVDVESNGKTFELGQGKLLHLTGDLATEKFDTKESDALARWSYRRAEYIAMANVSAAKSLRSGGYSGYSGLYAAGYGYGYGCTGGINSLWAFNPYFGMYTYVPCGGMYYSPYGFAYWSPGTVYRVYQRPVYNPGYGGGGAGYNSSLGYSTMSQTSSGYSGAISSAGYSGGYSGSSSAGASMGSSQGASVGAGAASSGGGGMSHGGGGGGGGHR